jgi:hypothetical protein
MLFKPLSKMSFLLSTAVQYLMIPREEVELDDVTSYNIFDTKIYTILIVIRYFGRPCDEFAERVWPIKIYDGA